MKRLRDEKKKLEKEKQDFKREITIKKTEIVREKKKNNEGNKNTIRTRETK